MTPFLYKYRPKPLEEYGTKKKTKPPQTKLIPALFAYSVYLHLAQALKAAVTAYKIKVCTTLQTDTPSRHFHLLSRVASHIKNCCRKIYT